MILLLLNLLYGVPSRMDTLMQDGLEMVYTQRYPEALFLFQEIVDLWPDEPAGYMLQAATYATYMLDYTTYEPEPRFYDLVEQTIRKARARLRVSKDPRERAWMFFFQGAAFLYRAERKVRHRDYLDAAKDGWRGYQSLMKAIELDSTLYDAYLGVGTVHVALSKIPGWIRFLMPFLPPGDVQRGLSEMRIASEKGRYVNVFAKDALAYTLAYLGRPQEALPLALETTHMYPENRNFLWTLAFVYGKMGYWRRWFDIHKAIFFLTVRDQFRSPYDLALSAYQLAAGYWYIRQPDKALWMLEVAEGLLWEADQNLPEWKVLHKNIEDLYRKLGEKPRGPWKKPDRAVLHTIVDSLQKGDESEKRAREDSNPQPPGP